MQYNLYMLSFCPEILGAQLNTHELRWIRPCFEGGGLEAGVEPGPKEDWRQEPGEVVRTGEEEDRPEARRWGSCRAGSQRAEAGLWTVDGRQEEAGPQGRIQENED